VCVSRWFRAVDKLKEHYVFFCGSVADLAAMDAAERGDAKPPMPPASSNSVSPGPAAAAAEQGEHGGPRRHSMGHGGGPRRSSQQGTTAGPVTTAAGAAGPGLRKSRSTQSMILRRTGSTATTSRPYDWRSSARSYTTGQLPLSRSGKSLTSVRTRQTIISRKEYHEDLKPAIVHVRTNVADLLPLPVRSKEVIYSMLEGA